MLLALALYAPSWRAPFIFDDRSAILNNATLTAWWPPWGPFVPPANTGVSGRPLVNLSFALDHLVSGGAPWSFHLGNMLLHGVAAWLVFTLVRRLFALAQPGRPATLLAWTLAALWAAHPLQTESVSCIVQRTEVLASVCYLATLVAFLRACEPSARRAWSIACVVACAAGMASKEIVVTAPVAVLLLDRAFVAGSFAAAWRARRRLYLTLAATWLLLALLVWSHGATRDGVVGFGDKASLPDYLLTQAKAVTLYLRLCVWPQPLVLDYGEDVVHGLAAAWLALSVVVALGAASLWALVRQPRAGTVAALFFVLLAPSSSFVPLVTQTMAEHRMYLALACVLGLAAALLQRATRHAPWILLLAAVSLAVVTVQRNRLYADPFALWQQTVQAAPENPRARIHYGNALLERGRIADATEEFRRALELRPGYPMATLNLGSVLLLQGRAKEALPYFEAGVQRDPRNAAIRLSRGSTLTALGREEEAFADFEAAVRLAPDYAPVHHELAVALVRRGRVPEAVAHLRRSAALDPAYAPPRDLLTRLGYALQP